MRLLRNLLLVAPLGVASSPPSDGSDHLDSASNELRVVKHATTLLVEGLAQFIDAKPLTDVHEENASARKVITKLQEDLLSLGKLLDSVAKSELGERSQQDNKIASLTKQSGDLAVKLQQTQLERDALDAQVKKLLEGKSERLSSSHPYGSVFLNIFHLHSPRGDPPALAAPPSMRKLVIQESCVFQLSFESKLSTFSEQRNH